MVFGAAPDPSTNDPVHDHQVYFLFIPWFFAVSPIMGLICVKPIF